MERARRPGKLAKELHGFYRGKIEVSLKSPMRDADGVHQVCDEFRRDGVYPSIEFLRDVVERIALE